MAGFEQRTSGVGSDRSNNWATTTAPNQSEEFVANQYRKFDTNSVTRRLDY